jgi:hypothetical protein
VLILLSTLLRHTSVSESVVKLPPDLLSKVIASLERGASLVYTKGFLRKGVGLCHGVSGSVYALLAASEVLPAGKNTVCFWQAVHLAHLATGYDNLTQRGEMRTPDRKWSLYEGTAGMCCAWGEVLWRMGDDKLEERLVASGCSGMPGFDDLHIITSV